MVLWRSCTWETSWKNNNNLKKIKSWRECFYFCHMFVNVLHKKLEPFYVVTLDPKQTDHVTLITPWLMQWCNNKEILSLKDFHSIMTWVWSISKSMSWYWSQIQTHKQWELGSVSLWLLFFLLEIKEQHLTLSGNAFVSHTLRQCSIFWVALVFRTAGQPLFCLACKESRKGCSSGSSAG